MQTYKLHQLHPFTISMACFKVQQPPLHNPYIFSPSHIRVPISLPLSALSRTIFEIFDAKEHCDLEV